MTDDQVSPADTIAETPVQPETAQMPVSEPLSEPPVEQSTGSTGQAIPQPAGGVEASEIVQEATHVPAEQMQAEPPEIAAVESMSPPPAATTIPTPANPLPHTSPHAARELLMKARAKVRTQKQQKLDSIMDALEKQGQIANNDVERLLGCSDATASRYLAELVKRGIIQKVGKTGAGVLYRKVS